jgi:hypothetical protein
MMNKEAVDKFAAQRPFEPFEIRLVDGRRFRFNKVEQFLVGRNVLMTLDRKGDPLHISLGLITTIGAASASRRRPRAGNG